MKAKIVLNIISYFFAVLFLYTAFSKILEDQNFILQIKNIDFLREYAEVLVWVVPVAELILSIFLILKSYRLAGLFGTFFLMLSFTIYVFTLLHFGDYKLCSCGGVIGIMTIKNHLWFNALLTVLAGVGVYLCPPSKAKI